MVQYVPRDSFRDCAGDICSLIVNVEKLSATSRVFLLHGGFQPNEISKPGTFRCVLGNADYSITRYVREIKERGQRWAAVVLYVPLPSRNARGSPLD